MRALTTALVFSALGAASAAGASRPATVRPADDLAVPYWFRTLERPGTVKQGGAPAASLHQDLVLLGTGSGRVLAIDARGQTAWVHEHRAAINGQPLAADLRIGEQVVEALLIGASDGAMLCLAVDGGGLLWSLTGLAGQVLARPRLEADQDREPGQQSLYLTTTGGAVQRVDAATGQVLWSFTHRGMARDMTVHGHAGVASSPDYNFVITGFSDGTLIRLDKRTGLVDWKYNLSTLRSQSFPDVDTTPLVSGDGRWVVAASISDGLFSLAADKPMVRWQRPDLSNVSKILALDPTTIVAASARGLVTAINVEDGLTRWELRLAPGEIGGLVLLGAYVAISSASEGLVLVDSFDGRPAQVFDVGAELTAPAAIGRGGQLYVVSRAGYLYSLLNTHVAAR